MGEIFMEDYILKGMEDFEGSKYNVLSLFFEGREIGTFSFYVTYDPYGDIMCVRPHLANIDPNFCRRGLGTGLIRRVAQEYKVHFVNSNNNPVEDKNQIHYTDEGYAWMRKCILIAGVSHDEEVNDDEYVEQ